MTSHSYIIPYRYSCWRVLGCPGNSTPDDTPVYEKLLGDGSRIGMRFSYKVQDVPRGLADAFIVGQDFIGDDRVCLILGDNVFFGQALTEQLRQAQAFEKERLSLGTPSMMLGLSV